jgi:hypothetical protein
LLSGAGRVDFRSSIQYLLNQAFGPQDFASLASSLLVCVVDMPDALMR